MAKKIALLVCYYYYYYYLVISSCIVGITQGQLKVGFYESTCRDAESIVSGFVRDAAQSDRTSIPVLIRLHFHDCFVQGCDGSILIEGPDAEQHAFAHQGVRGRDIIERAKAQLEATCPGVVSCADIVALAARDAVALANGPAYEVPTGRRDGVVSNKTLADEIMPDVADPIQLLKFKFLKQGLSEKDLVLLSSAHTIGTTACFFMNNRLYDFPPQGGPDPSINPQILPELTSNCPQNGDDNVRIPLDHNSGEIFDNQILQNIRNGFAVLQSDAALYQDEATKRVVDSYIDPLSALFGASFEGDFAEAMVKMGMIGIKTGEFGEIRRVCSSFN